MAHCIWESNAINSPPHGNVGSYQGEPGGPPRPVRRMRPSPSQQHQQRKQLKNEHTERKIFQLGSEELVNAEKTHEMQEMPPPPGVAPSPRQQVINKPESPLIENKNNLEGTDPMEEVMKQRDDEEKKKDASSAMHHIQESKTREELRYRPVIVGICGGTGSGKTTLTKAIVERLGAEHVSLISHDSYYKDLQHLTVEERANVNFDHPDALDSSLLHQHLCQLKEGLPVKCPVYDFTTHSRQLDKYEMVNPSKIVLVDGILIFAEPCLLDSMDMKIFVDTADDIRLVRRLTRDVAERARTVDSVIDQYHATVRPMHKLFVEPSRRAADIIVPSEAGIQEVALDMVVSRLRELIAQHEKDLEELRKRKWV